MGFVGNMSVEAVFLDLDGVAIDNNQIVPGAAEGIRYVKERAIPIMPVTGRAFERSLWLTEPLGFEGYGVFSGGAEISSFVERRTIWKKVIDQQVAREVAEQLIPYSERMNVGVGNKLLTESNPLDYITEDSLGIWAEFPLTYLSEVELILGALNSQHGLQHHYNHGTVKPDIAGVHITHKRANKFYTTQLLMRWMGIDPQNAAAFGDGDSDIPLFEAVGTGIAMANATEALKAKAHHITSDVRDHGLQRGIEKYL